MKEMNDEVCSMHEHAPGHEEEAIEYLRKHYPDVYEAMGDLTLDEAMKVLEVRIRDELRRRG